VLSHGPQASESQYISACGTGLDFHSNLKYTAQEIESSGVCLPGLVAAGFCFNGSALAGIARDRPTPFSRELSRTLAPIDIPRRSARSVPRFTKPAAALPVQVVLSSVGLGRPLDEGIRRNPPAEQRNTGPGQRPASTGWNRILNQ
jgi:hypothetical protein